MVSTPGLGYPSSKPGWGGGISHPRTRKNISAEIFKSSKAHHFHFRVHCCRFITNLVTFLPKKFQIMSIGNTKKLLKLRIWLYHLHLFLKYFTFVKKAFHSKTYPIAATPMAMILWQPRENGGEAGALVRALTFRLWPIFSASWGRDPATLRAELHSRLKSHFLDTHDDGVQIVLVHVPDSLLPVPGVADGYGRVVAQLPPLVFEQGVRGVDDHREVKPALNDPFFNDVG